MFVKLLIGLTAFLVVGSAVSAAGWSQPSWAPESIPLVDGQVYRTGSPLSRPGLGLFGAILDSVTGGYASALTAIRSTGGGFIQWRGQSAPACTGIEIDGECVPTLTHAQAKAAQDAIDWPTVENKPRVTVPQCADGQRLWVTMVPDQTLGTRLIYSCR